MAGLEMHGPFELNHWTVDRVIVKAVPGNYALGIYDGKKFEAKFIGRSDDDLRQVLIEHCANCDYGHFKARYAPNAREAYYMQCRNYHDHPEMADDGHPVCPEGTILRCPVCGK